MLDLDGDVVSEGGMLRVERFHDRQRVRGTVEEIGVAEGNVLGAGGHLASDISENCVALYDAKGSVIDRNHRTVPAQMLAATAGLGIAGKPLLAVQKELRVAVEGR